MINSVSSVFIYSRFPRKPIKGFLIATYHNCDISTNQTEYCEFTVQLKVDVGPWTSDWLPGFTTN